MTSMLLLVFTALLTRLDPTAAALLADFTPRPRLEEFGSHAVEQSTKPAGIATVQIDLVPDFDAAELLAGNVRTRLDAAGLGHPVHLEALVSDPGMPVSYRVVIGPFAEFEDAERARTELDALGVDGFVRELEPASMVGC